MVLNTTDLIIDIRVIFNKIVVFWFIWIRIRSSVLIRIKWFGSGHAWFKRLLGGIQGFPSMRHFDCHLKICFLVLFRLLKISFVFWWGKHMCIFCRVMFELFLFIKVICVLLSLIKWFRDLVAIVNYILLVNEFGLISYVVEMCAGGHQGFSCKSLITLCLVSRKNASSTGSRYFWFKLTIDLLLRLLSYIYFIPLIALSSVIIPQRIWLVRISTLFLLFLYKLVILVMVTFLPIRFLMGIKILFLSILISILLCIWLLQFSRSLIWFFKVLVMLIAVIVITIFERLHITLVHLALVLFWINKNFISNYMIQI